MTLPGLHIRTQLVMDTRFVNRSLLFNPMRDSRFDFIKGLIFRKNYLSAKTTVTVPYGCSPIKTALRDDSLYMQRILIGDHPYGIAIVKTRLYQELDGGKFLGALNTYKIYVYMYIKIIVAENHCVGL